MISPFIYVTRRCFVTTKEQLPIKQLKGLYELFSQVNNTPSKLEKYALLTQYPNCCPTLQRIYNPHLRHHTTSKAAIGYLNKHSAEISKSSEYADLNDLLDSLSSKKITGHAALEAIASFYLTYCQTEEYQQLFWRIIDRNLKMGVSIETVRQLLSNSETDELSQKGSAPFTKVALASSLSKGKNILNSENINSWFASQKLDGVRCLTIIRPVSTSEYDIQFYSRTGRRFHSLQKVKEELEQRLKQTGLSEMVLDGEICVYREDGREDFLKTMGLIRRMTEDMEKPVYQVFDMISPQELVHSKGHTVLHERQNRLREFIGDNSMVHVKQVQQIRLNDMDHLEALKKEAIENGWEGLILRKDVVYEGKRTRNMIKIKEWEDAEYTVKNIERGLMRMPTGEDKLVMTNVYIEHKGSIVSVGSGFTLDQRVAFAEDPSLIIGKPITVKYFSESKTDKNDTTSLRFPTVKAIYEDTRDV